MADSIPPPSPFLHLPPELRNEIYEHAAASGPITLRDKHFIAPTQLALSAASKQVAHEYLPILRAYTREQAQDLSFHVRNWEFEALKDFLASLQPLQHGQKRQLSILITIHREDLLQDGENGKFEKLKQWLRFCRTVGSSVGAMRRIYRLRIEGQEGEGGASGTWLRVLGIKLNVLRVTEGSGEGGDVEGILEQVRRVS